MTYNQTTRNELYNKFIESHQPGAMFNLLHGADAKDIFGVVTKMQYNYTAKQKEIYEKFRKSIDGYSYAPAKFFKTHYPKIVEICAGSKDEAALLYKYFDKLNQFQYSTGYGRRTVRTDTYINPVDKVKNILYAAYHLQLYNTTLDKYLLNDMSEELVDYKNNYKIKWSGLQDIIAAHIDAGDITVKNALVQIITGENNVAFLTTDIIRAVFKSEDKDLHKLLGQLLVAARLQEGVRQAICENMDCGTIQAFRTLFEVIEENDLLRYSAVRRAVATWIGILDPDHLVRSSNKTFKLMKEVVFDKNRAHQLVDSDDAMSILVGLWGIGFYEVKEAVKVMERIVDNGTIQQKRVATYYNQAIEDRKTQQKFANKIIESPELDIELAAGILDTYMSDCENEALMASGRRIGYEDEPRPVNLKLWFADRETAKKHLNILINLLNSMQHKKYQFSPYVFPWYFTTITRGNVLIRICAIANGLMDDDLMDKLAEMLSELDGQGSSRTNGVRLLFSRELTPRRRELLIDTLGDKETSTRKEAFKIAKEMEFAPEEYDRMCQLLRFRATDLRLNLISLIKQQNDTGLQRSLNILLTDKREDMRLAGLDILCGLINDTDSEGNIRTDVDGAVALGKKLVKEIAAPTEREQIFINEIFNTNEEQVKSDEDELYTDADIIPLPKMNYKKEDYPLLKISKKRLAELYTKLDNLIDEYKDYEIKTAYGEKVLLGNCNFLPQMKYAGTPEERYPLISVWKEFYETEIKTPDDLMAMLLAIIPYRVTVGYGNAQLEDKVYNKFIFNLAKDVFGEAVLNFDITSYKYGKAAQRAVSNAVSGGDLFHGIIRVMFEIYLDTNYLHNFGKKAAKYLCCNVPEDKRMADEDFRSGPSNRITYVTPLNSLIFGVAINGFADKWNSADQFKERFNTFLVLTDMFMKLPEGATQWETVRVNDNFRLKSVDYVTAAYYGIITEAQMFRSIFEEGTLRERLQNLFIIYRAEKWPWLKNQISKYGVFENEELNRYLCDKAHTAADRIVKVECKRGDSHTKYSQAVTAIEFFYGTDHLIKLLTALGKDKFVRKDGYGLIGNGSRKVNLCHLISVCNPLPEDNIETFTQALKGTSINEKRLIEVAMYAPQWIDLIEEYLDFKGLKIGAYYFMAHMNDQYNRDQRKFATIARFTPLEKEELFNGAFDIDWFNEAYSILGEKRFAMLYEAAKYTSDGSRHTRARKYADATLGKVTVIELEAEIKEKRNKDLLMSYPLVPLADKADMLHRYQFIQQFRKESTQFGSQRRASEGLACDMAMRNLATRAGFKDTTRLSLVMEMALAESLKSYFEWTKLDNGKDVIQARIQVTESGKPEVVVRKEKKILASVPSAFKKDPYILQLKESNKKFREQYSRTVKMFELSMEERELYSVQEITELTANPVIAPVVENLVFISDDKQLCGTVSAATGIALIDATGEVHNMDAADSIRVAHPYDLYKACNWSTWQQFFFEKQNREGSKQPFRQVFRELYVKLNEEKEQNYSRLFAGHQIQPTKTVATLKTRRWIADHESGLEKIFYKDNIAVTMYALADWFSPSDIEPPTLEYVAFSDRKTFKFIPVGEVPDIVYSEAMRDVDLAVSVAHAGSVDPQASHSTVAMRKVIVLCNIELFGLKNVTVEGTHAFIKGSLGEYTVHLGSGVVHMRGVHQLNVLPVHSQHRGKIFLPFLDEDPKTAEIISKIILFADDKKIKDPYILEQMR